MHGLTVRWSLADATPDVLDRLRDYIATVSHERFSGKPGLGFKTWRARPGEWFEGSYVFASTAEREAFQEQFSATASEAPGSMIIGSAPVLIEPCEVIAVAEGGGGFHPAASFGPAG